MTDGSRYIRAAVSIAASPGWMETPGRPESLLGPEPTRQRPTPRCHALPLPYADRSHLASGKPIHTMSIFVVLIPSEFSIL